MRFNRNALLAFLVLFVCLISLAVHQRDNINLQLDQIPILQDASRFSANISALFESALGSDAGTSTVEESDSILTSSSKPAEPVNPRETSEQSTEPPAPVILSTLPTTSTGQPASAVSTTATTPTNPPPVLDFGFSYTDVSACEPPTTARKRVIAVIFSAPDHFASRMMVRSTWVKYMNDLDINGTYFFIIGATADKEIQRMITEENTGFADIIQYGFHDSYLNLTYKTLASLKFLSTICNNSGFDFVLKTDDDMFVNLPGLLTFADQHRTCGRYLSRAFFCNSYRPRDPVPRNPNDKWYVSKGQYADDFYPKFCAGTGYMFTWDLVAPLLDASKSLPYYHLEDVYVSGICAKEVANVSYVQVYGGTFVHTVQNFKQIGSIFGSIERPQWRAPNSTLC